MKKKSSLIYAVPVLIAVALLNLIIFLTFPKENFEINRAFWLGWAFAFPVNLILAAGVFLLMEKKGIDAFMQVPIRRVVIIAAAVYVVAGAIFMYVPIQKLVVPAVVECVITGVYLIALFYAFAPMTKIKDSQQAVKEKVIYVKLLQSDLESCFAHVSDAALLDELKKLSEKIRFSDPMSHPSLAGCEAELSVAVNTIVSKVKNGNVEDIADDINTASGLVDFRNSRCKILK